jgi:hypothetical protein
LEASLGKTEATDLEANPEEIESEAEHEEVPKEEAAVKTGRALKERHGDGHLAVSRRGKPKKRTQGNGRSRKKLAVARRWMTRRARVTRRKGHGHTGPTVKEKQRKMQTRENVARGTSKRRTFGKRHRAKPEGIAGIRN